MTTLEAVWTPTWHQTVYRALVRVTSYPGEFVELGDEQVWLSVLATLCDDAVVLADPGGMIDERSREFLRSPAGDVSNSDFVLVSAKRAPTASFRPRLGDLENPEFGATLVLVGECVGEGALALRLRGPGIDGERDLRVTGFHPGWFGRRADWVATFPLGVDIILCDERRVAALPRTTVVELEV